MTRLSLNSALLSVAIALSLPTVAAAQNRTIIGEWANKIEECGTHWSYKIGAKHLYADEFMCEFRTVDRVGNQVRWEGACDEGNGPEADTVLANDVESGLVLHFVKGGGSIGPLQSCNRR